MSNKQFQPQQQQQQYPGSSGPLNPADNTMIYSNAQRPFYPQPTGPTIGRPVSQIGRQALLTNGNNIQTVANGSMNMYPMISAQQISQYPAVMQLQNPGNRQPSPNFQPWGAGYQMPQQGILYRPVMQQSLPQQMQQQTPSLQQQAANHGIQVPAAMQPPPLQQHNVTPPQQPNQQRARKIITITNPDTGEDVLANYNKSKEDEAAKQEKTKDFETQQDFARQVAARAFEQSPVEEKPPPQPPVAASHSMHVPPQYQQPPPPHHVQSPPMHIMPPPHHVTPPGVPSLHMHAPQTEQTKREKQLINETLATASDTAVIPSVFNIPPPDTTHQPVRIETPPTVIHMMDTDTPGRGTPATNKKPRQPRSKERSPPVENHFSPAVVDSPTITTDVTTPPPVQHTVIQPPVDLTPPAPPPPPPPAPTIEPEPAPEPSPEPATESISVSNESSTEVEESKAEGSPVEVSEPELQVEDVPETSTSTAAPAPEEEPIVEESPPPEEPAAAEQSPEPEETEDVSEESSPAPAEEEESPVTETEEEKPSPPSWGHVTDSGMRVYNRDFLIKMFDSAALSKPDTIQPNRRLTIVKDKPNHMQIPIPSRSQVKLPNMSRSTDQDFFTPNYAFKGGAKSGGKSHSRNNPRDSRGPPPQQQYNTPQPIRINLDFNNIELHKAEKSWKPTNKEKEGSTDKETTATSDDPAKAETEELYKKVRSILNKLTPQKFDTLLNQINNLNIDTQNKLAGVIDLVFDKAVAEPGFSTAYAQLCQNLSLRQVPTNTNPQTFVNFRKILLTRCQQEFEKDKTAELDRAATMKIIEKETEANKKTLMKMELEEKMQKIRRRYLGNIRFIGELYKKNMLTPKIMHDCLQKLLTDTDDEKLECLCRLLSTIGKTLEQSSLTQKDSSKRDTSNKEKIDSYFKEIGNIIEGKKTSSRVRFMLQDVTDLRSRHWKPRRDEAAPKTIDDIHKEIKQEQQVAQIELMNFEEKKKEERRKESHGGGGKQRDRPQQNREDNSQWSTVTQSQSRTVRREQIDPSKFKGLSKQMNEDCGMRLGPMPGSGWSRGSAGGGGGKHGATQSMSADRPAVQANRFASLSSDRDIPHSQYDRSGGPGSRSGSQSKEVPGRHTGPLVTRASYGGRMSQERDKERQQALTLTRRSMQGTAGASRETSRSRVEPPVDTHKFAGNSQLSEDKARTLTDSIVGEYLNSNDQKEVLKCLLDDFHVDTMHYFVFHSVNHTLEQSSGCRLHLATLLAALVKERMISQQQLVKGLKILMDEDMGDILIDIPKFFQYIAEILQSVISEAVVPMSFLLEIGEQCIKDNFGGKLLANLLNTVKTKIGAPALGTLWQSAGVDIALFLPADANVNKWVEECGLECIVGGVEEPPRLRTAEDVRRDTHSRESQLRGQLNTALRSHTDNDNLMGYIDKNLSSYLEEAEFVRALSTEVLLESIPPSCKDDQINEEVLNKRASILIKYIQNMEPRELQCLYAVQNIVEDLSHPRGLACKLFETLYQSDVISENGFNTWRSGKPMDPRGYGVTSSEVSKFFTWLSLNEEDKTTSRQ